MKVIAVEEAFVTQSILDAWKKILEDGSPGEAGFDYAIGRIVYGTGAWGLEGSRRMLDLDDLRLQHMEEGGVDMQVVALTAPGTQVFDADTGTALATEANDILAEGVKRHPDKLAGLAAIAPQSPQRAAKEMERAKALGLKGVIVNSHTKGEYLDAAPYRPILEAAESLGLPIYIHPRGTPPSMIGAFAERHLDSALWGFQTDAALHALRLIVTGAFDMFPNLQIVLGHLGEGLPFWLNRLDRSFGRCMRSPDLHPHLRCKRPPSEYYLENFWLSSAGHNWDPAVRFVIEVVGEDRLMFAVDYPYEETRQQVDQAAAIKLPNPEKFYELNARKVFNLD